MARSTDKIAITEKQFESQVKDLDELMLIIKQRLKLLNAFSFGLEKKSMLYVRQCYQICKAVLGKLTP